MLDKYTLEKQVTQYVDTAVSKKVDKSDIVDRVDSTDSTKVLSAFQGKKINDRLSDTIGKIPTKTSQLTNDSNYITNSAYSYGYMMQLTEIDASGLDENTWYPVTIAAGE